MMPHKGASTQCHNQQVLAKPCHNPSNRDQQVREKLQQRAKIRSRAYIQLGEVQGATAHNSAEWFVFAVFCFVTTFAIVPEVSITLVMQ